MISSTNEGARFTVYKTDEKADQDQIGDSSGATEKVDQTITEETISGNIRHDCAVYDKFYGIFLCL